MENCKQNLISNCDEGMSWEESNHIGNINRERFAAKENGLVPLEDNHVVVAQPFVVLPLYEYRALKKKVDEAKTAISYAEEVGRLLSLLDDLGGMSEKMKNMITNAKQLFRQHLINPTVSLSLIGGEYDSRVIAAWRNY